MINSGRTELPGSVEQMIVVIQEILAYVEEIMGIEEIGFFFGSTFLTFLAKGQRSAKGRRFLAMEGKVGKVGCAVFKFQIPSLSQRRGGAA